MDELQIATITKSYRQQRPRFDLAAQRVADRLRRELREAGVKNMISHRSKHPTGLADKLRDKAKKKPDTYRWDALRDDIGMVVTDLAGCRVVVYTAEDEQFVGELVPRIFAMPARPDAKVDRRRGLEKPYWATHCLVFPYAPEAPDEALEGTICELQIVTVAAHLFNELEHDITYKEGEAKADDEEKQILIELRGVARVADRLVGQLIDHRSRRIDDATRAIADAEELRFALWALAKRRVDGTDLGRLLGILEQCLERVTQESIRELGEVDTLIATGRRILAEQASEFDEVVLYTVGLTEQFGPEIFSAQKGWRGPKTALRKALQLVRSKNEQLGAVFP